MGFSLDEFDVSGRWSFHSDWVSAGLVNFNNINFNTITIIIILLYYYNYNIIMK